MKIKKDKQNSLLQYENIYNKKGGLIQIFDKKEHKLIADLTYISGRLEKKIGRRYYADDVDNSWFNIYFEFTDKLDISTYADEINAFLDKKLDEDGISNTWMYSVFWGQTLKLF